MKKISSVLCFVLLFNGVNAQTINTIAGVGNTGTQAENVPAISSKIVLPGGLIFDKHSNLYFVTGGGHRVRMIEPNGLVHTVAGTGMQGNTGDGGLAINAELNQPECIAFDSVGNIYFSCGYSHNVRKIDIATGIITTYAGTGTSGYGGDGGPATSALLNLPQGICFDKKGNLYIAEYPNHRVRKVAPDGIITTFAGTGAGGYNGDGGLADTSLLSSPFDVRSDDTGNIYIADASGRIRKVDTFGIIHSLAGNGVTGYTGDGGPAINAQISTEFITVDKFGNIYMTEGNTHRVRKIDSAGIISTVAGNGTLGFAGDGGPAIDAILYGPQSVTTDSCGNLFIGDTHNYRIRKVTYYADCSQVDTTDTTTAIHSIATTGSISIYPNPANQQITISGGSNVQEAMILNTIGQVLIAQKSYSNKAVIDVSALGTGIYFIKVIDSSGAEVVKRFLKE